jgi:serine/threonine-protein kinase
LAYYGTGGGEDAIWILSVDSEGAGTVFPRQAIDGPGVQRAGAFSPDGGWFAYSSDESGRDEIYLRPYPDLDARRYIVSREGGVDPHWSADSSELFYRNGDAMLVAEISPESEAVVGSPRELFHGHFHFQENEDQSFDVFPDGERFLMIQPTPESRRELRVITNALEGLNP